MRAAGALRLEVEQLAGLVAHVARQQERAARAARAGRRERRAGQHRERARASGSLSSSCCTAARESRRARRTAAARGRGPIVSAPTATARWEQSCPGSPVRARRRAGSRRRGDVARDGRERGRRRRRPGPEICPAAHAHGEHAASPARAAGPASATTRHRLAVRRLAWLEAWSRASFVSRKRRPPSSAWTPSSPAQPSYPGRIGSPSAARSAEGTEPVEPPEVLAVARHRLGARERQRDHAASSGLGRHRGPTARPPSRPACRRAAARAKRPPGVSARSR